MKLCKSRAHTHREKHACQLIILHIQLKHFTVMHLVKYKDSYKTYLGTVGRKFHLQLLL